LVFHAVGDCTTLLVLWIVNTAAGSPTIGQIVDHRKVVGACTSWIEAM